MKERSHLRWYWFLEPSVLLAVYVTGLCAGAVYRDDPRLGTRFSDWLTIAFIASTTGWVVFRHVYITLGRPLSRPGLRFHMAWVLYLAVLLLAYVVFE